MNLSEDIKNVIDAYHENCEKQKEDMKKALEVFKLPSYIQRYSQEGLAMAVAEAVDVIKKAWLAEDVSLNEKIKKLIAVSKAEALPALGKDQGHTGDYAVRINNAIQFLQMEGAGITDNTAYGILKDFTNDMETIKRFKRFIERMNGEPGCGEGVPYPKTFGRLETVEKLLDLYTEMEGIAERLFLHKRTDSATYMVFNSQRIALPEDTYAELDAESQLQEHAAAAMQITERTGG